MGFDGNSASINLKDLGDQSLFLKSGTSLNGSALPKLNLKSHNLGLNNNLKLNLRVAHGTDRDTKKMSSLSPAKKISNSVSKKEADGSMFEPNKKLGKVDNGLQKRLTIGEMYK